MNEQWEARDMRRQGVIRKAISAVNRIIQEGSDGSAAEIDWLTGAITLEMTKKVLCAFQLQLYRKDLEEDHPSARLDTGTQTKASCT